MELRHRGNRSDPSQQMETFQVLESIDSDPKDELDRRTENQKCLFAVPTLTVTLTALIIINVFVYYMDNRLPDAVEANSTSDGFVAGRAMTTLVKLAGLGPRPVGSYENEKLAFELITAEVRGVIEDAGNVNNVQMLNQRVSGSFLLDMKGWKYLLSYEDLQNVVVRVDPKGRGDGAADNGTAVLLNCHYDTVPAGPGVSDNGVNCAVMVELLRVLAKGSDLRRPVVFLFNGGEEIILQASHGFVTQHQWARGARYVINLDSCGAGGREILFQTTRSDAYLADVYARAVPRPYGQAVAEELFQSGAVPSDTDFRIFRDYGNMSGLDLAHFRNGYVYHTAYDDLDRVEPAVLQHTGDNLLALVKAVSAQNASGRAAPPRATGVPVRQSSSSKYVYFDVFGVYMFSYTELSGTVANLVIVLVSLCSIFLSMRSATVGMNRRQYTTHMLSTVVLSPACAALLAGLSCVLVAYCLDWLDRSMSWYSNRVNLSVYAATASLAFVAAAVWHPRCAAAGSPRTDAERAVSLLNGVQFYWTALLFVATMAGLRSAYVPAVVVLFPTVAGCALGVLQNANARPVGPQWAAVYATSLIVPAVFVCYLTQMCLTLFVPLAGRSGPDLNPDYVVAGLMAASAYATVGHVAPMAVLVRNPRTLLAGLAVWASLSAAVVVVSPLGFPYTAPAPDWSPRTERFDLLRTRRTFYDLSGAVRHNDSGYTVINWDRHGPRAAIREAVPAMRAAVPVDCAAELMCGVPVVGGLAAGSSWIPLRGRPPADPTPARTETAAVVGPGGRRRRLEFRITGPERLTVYVSPYPGTELKAWSFPDAPKVSTRWGEHDVYVVRHSRGGTGADDSQNATWDFWLEQESDRGFDGRTINVTVTYSWVVRKRLTLDDAFRSLVDSFPRWAHVNYAIATVDAFVF